MICLSFWGFSKRFPVTELATGSLLACFPCRFADVRSQLRKDLGYTEEDGFGALSFLEPSKTEKSGHSPSMCSLSSGGQISTQPVSPSAHRSVSKSPDCLSSRIRLLYSLISLCVAAASAVSLAGAVTSMIFVTTKVLSQQTRLP